ncbi:MAG: hypothetical protein AAF488_10585, partial [Planctomycetota bacterium]
MFGFGGPAEIPDTASSEIDFFIETEGRTGNAQAWTMGASGTHLEFLDFTTEGTVADHTSQGGLRSDGFERTELVSGPLGPGAVTTVILSSTGDVTLDSSARVVVASLVVLPVPGAVDARIFYTDDLTLDGSPVVNQVHVDGETIPAVLWWSNMAVFHQPLCGDPQSVHLEFRSEVFHDADGEPFDSVPPERLDLLVPVDRAEGTAVVYPTIVSNDAEVSGWSLAIAGPITRATTEDTVGAGVDDGPLGIRGVGFEKTELIDATYEDQGPGVVSMVVLSFLTDIGLPSAGRSSVLALTVKGDPGEVVVLEARDGLVRSS